MKEYLALLFGVCLISGIVRSVSPDGAMKKHIEFLCSICMLAAIVLPFANAFLSDGIDGAFDLDIPDSEYSYEEIYTKYLEENNIQMSEQILATELAQRLGVPPESISVSIDAVSAENGLEVTQIQVILGIQAAATDPDIITSYIMERVGVECSIVYDF